MYTDKQIKFARIGLNVIWIFAAACFFFPLYDMGIGGLGRALFWLLVCVHLVEFALFFRLYQGTGESLFGHFMLHMAYGVIYQAEVKQRVAAQQGAE